MEKEITIQLEEANNKGRAFVGDAQNHLAEMTFSRAGQALIIIDHTEVSETLRGQGVGRKMLDAIVAMARKQSIKILPLCPYAKSVFEKDASIANVLK